MIHNGHGFFGSFLACIQPPLTSKKIDFFEVRGGCTKDRSFSTPDTYGPEKSKRYKLEHISCLSSCTAHLYGHFLTRGVDLTIYFIRFIRGW